MSFPLLERLAQLGWKNDKNLEIDLRWGGMDLDQMQRRAKEIVEAQPEVIQVTTTPATAAILRETRTLPVVFAVVSDPVGAGFVQNLAHPGGNATGFVNIEGSIGSKWLEILKQIAPGTSRVLVPFNPNTSPQSTYYLKSLEAAAPALTLTVSAAHVSSAGEIEAAVADLAQSPGGGLVIIPDIYTAIQSQRDLIISLAARHPVPRFIRKRAIVPLRSFQVSAPRTPGRVIRGWRGDPDPPPTSAIVLHPNNAPQPWGGRPARHVSVDKCLASRVLLVKWNSLHAVRTGLGAAATLSFLWALA